MRRVADRPAICFSGDFRVFLNAMLDMWCAIQSGISWVGFHLVWPSCTKFRRKKVCNPQTQIIGDSLISWGGGMGIPPHSYQ